MPDAKEIWFHGSRAIGKEKRRSDWDVLVVVPETITGGAYIDIVLALQSVSARFPSARFDIQPTHPTGNLIEIAREEGRLLWPSRDEPLAVAEGLPPRDIERARALGIPTNHGRIVGAPKGTPATVTGFLELAETLSRRAGSKTAHPRDWHWYSDAGRVIREYAGPSHSRREKLVRLIAKTSQRAPVEGNARAAVEAAISLA